MNIAIPISVGATRPSYYPVEIPKSQPPPWRSATTSTLQVETIAANTAMPQFKANEDLSPEDREAREKSLRLATHIEQLYQADEEFRRWYHKGLDDIEAGRTVAFSEDGWSDG